MKKFILVAILGLGVFVVGCRATHTAKTDEVSSTAEKTDEMSSSATKANFEDLSDEQFKQFSQLFNDCLDNENALSCQRLIDSGFLPSAEECNDRFCDNIGAIYEGIKDYQQAFKYYKKTCDLNPNACHNVGVSYVEGKGVKQDFVNARRYFEKACNEYFAWACNNLGVLYANGQGVKQDKSTAKKYLGRACDLGLKIACDNYKKLNKQGVK